MLMLERVWPAGLAEAKDQEGQTTGVGYPRGMWLQWRIEDVQFDTLQTLNLDVLFISFILRCFNFKHFKHQHFFIKLPFL